MKQRYHELKCWPEFLTVLLSGVKTFDVRRDDRGFQVGDLIKMREFWPDDDTTKRRGFGEREAWFEITYRLSASDIPVLKDFLPLTQLEKSPIVILSVVPWLGITEDFVTLEEVKP